MCVFCGKFNHLTVAARQTPGINTNALSDAFTALSGVGKLKIPIFRSIGASWFLSLRHFISRGNFSSVARRITSRNLCTRLPKFRFIEIYRTKMFPFYNVLRLYGSFFFFETRAWTAVAPLEYRYVHSLAKTFRDTYIREISRKNVRNYSSLYS